MSEPSASPARSSTPRYRHRSDQRLTPHRLPRVLRGRAAVAILAVAGVAVGVTGFQAASAALPTALAPMVEVPGTQIEGQYIVVIKQPTGASAMSEGTSSRRRTADWVRSNGGSVGWSYGTAVNGFSAKLSAQKLAKLRANADVAYVQPDTMVTINEVQANATSGLDRIDQRALPINKSYTFDTTASSVTAYVIDTGVRATHVDLAGRVSSGATAINDGRGSDDCNGHGTHVAGTIGGRTFGVAKAVKIVPVRVLDCTGRGPMSGIIAGIDFVTRTARGPSVANLSLGSPANPALDAAVQRSIAAGVVYSIAAGNSSEDACNASPARTPEAITVGATDVNDNRASFSNFGRCVDLFAPGVRITSLSNTSDRAVQTLSGTSMSAPHVTGVAALVLAANPRATPAQVRAAIVSGATRNVVRGAGPGSPNRLLFSRVRTAGAGQPTTQPPGVTNPITQPGSTNPTTPPGGDYPTLPPGGTNPGGTNPGGTDPGGMYPGGNNPGGNNPGGMYPTTPPGGGNPGGSNPDGSNPGGTDPGQPPSGTYPDGSNPGGYPGGYPGTYPGGYDPNQSAGGYPGAGPADAPGLAPYPAP